MRDRETGTTVRVTVSSAGAEANDRSWTPKISADGRCVVFGTDATTLGFDTEWKSDVFVHARQTGATEWLAASTVGDYAISADGRFVALVTRSADVFVRDRESGRSERVSVASDGSQSNGASGSATISADGRLVAFGSAASNLVPGDTNGTSDVFVRRTADPAPCTVVGTPGDDVLYGTYRNDIICGLEGNDRLHGLAGWDLLRGGSGDDRPYAGFGQRPPHRGPRGCTRARAVIAGGKERSLPVGRCWEGNGTC